MRKIKFALSLVAMLMINLFANAMEVKSGDYTLSYDKAGELLKLTKEGCTSYETTYEGGATLDGYAGYFSFNPADPDWTFMGNTCIAAYVLLADGTYTLHVQAGTYLFNGVKNEAFDITFTVGNAGGGGGNAGNFSGTPSHETIFKAGETVPAIPFVVDNENVNIVTVGKPFLDTTIDVGYNMNSTKELNWKNGTKFVITAKTDINKVIFVPTDDSKAAIAYASAEGGNGSYTNGVWEGKLAAGEVLTLTANDGINIKEFYICYNGDDFDPIAGGSDVKGVITIQYPVENQLIAKQVDGGKFCTFTTNKEYAQVTIEVRNDNAIYDNLYKFPTRMVDNMGEKSDNLHVGQNTVTAATPASGNSGRGDDWYWFKGDSYTMIVKGYINPWDAADDYDAMAEVHFIGDGKPHTVESLVKLLNVSPMGSMDEPGEMPKLNGVITLEFDAPVASVEAVTPQGFDGVLKHTATAVAGSDDKVWEISLGDLSNFGDSQAESSYIEVDVTAKDANGAVVVFSDDRSDRGLVLNYKLVEGGQPTKVVTLGAPVWSIYEGAEIDASTKSININFPYATNVEPTYTLEVSGTIGDKNFNLKNVSGTGTIGAGAEISVNLAEDVAYNLVIGTITIKDGSEVVYSTDQANYQLNFATKSSQGDDNNVVITVDGTTLNAAFPVGTDLGDNYAEKPYIMNGETKIDVADYYIDNTTGGFLDPLNLIVITLNATLADGDYTLVLPAGMFIVNGGDNNAEICIPFTVGTATSINGIASDNNNSVIFNIAGQRINNAKRIVIMNGKKFMVK